MEWKDIKITVPKKDADTAEAIATGVSGGGIYIEDYSDLEAQVQAIAHVDLIEEDLLQKDRNIVAIHLYLSPEQNLAEVVDLLHQRLHALLIFSACQLALRIKRITGMADRMALRRHPALQIQ